MKKLAIVVGHTRTSVGAFAGAPINQSEYDWNGDLAARMKAHAEEHLADALAVEVFTRDDGGVRGAYRRARAWGADAAMELHFNAAGPGATGTETLYLTAASKVLAEAIQDATVDVLGLKDRGVKTPHEASGGRGAHNLSQMGARPSILTEPFFGSNPADRATAHARKQDLAAAQVTTACQVLNALYDDDEDGERATVTASALNVRGGPGVEFDKLSWGPLPADTVLVVLECGTVWWKVCIPDDPRKVGFVHSAYVT
ncbi:N-acetylmuramoyl-L-alanine amidase [Rhodospira trueperi]|uniref:N-acetylmuramoyl-L-alanine amidase n=1 Tax=Rhodospira trueperi TaxID=69960 RepID=A0A1G6XVK7_9PROT|nr:N-acetylmuramoyl-L-alanine amidase [Rhodospira trueperi]SDD82218.1 N-acetylmuramoyl-L-alanine amidase [Rhodospira trueperi]